jgi:hypothetical protein
MANDVTNPNTNAVIDPYQKFADEVASRPFDGDLLRFTKHGEYKAGQDQQEIPDGTRMLVFMPGLKWGWVKWEDNVPVANVMGLINEGFDPPERDELGDDDETQWGELNGRPIDPWQKTNHLPMCDSDGTLYTFVSSSKGGLSAIGELSKAYVQRRRMKPDEIPVVELLSRSYIHKDYGETFAPSFKIIGWTSIPHTFTELRQTVEDNSDETLALEDLMHEQEEEVEPPKQAAKVAPTKSAPQKPAAKAAPAKSAPQKPVAAVARGGKNNKRPSLRY